MILIKLQLPFFRTANAVNEYVEDINCCFKTLAFSKIFAYKLQTENQEFQVSCWFIHVIIALN